MALSDGLSCRGRRLWECLGLLWCNAPLRMRPLACPSVLCLCPAPVIDYDALRSEAAGALTHKVADINVLRTRLVRAERAADDTLAM